MQIKVQHKPTGLILAGGGSQRFGVDKALYQWQGKPLIGHVFEALSTVADPVLVAGGANPIRYSIPAQIVQDEQEDAGPLAGLQAGLRAAQTPWVLVLPCDVPFITTNVLHALLAARTPEFCAVIARTPDGRLHPLCGCYAPSVLPIIDTLLAEQKRAVHGLLDVLPAVKVVDVPEEPMRNINRLRDLRATH